MAGPLFLVFFALLVLPPLLLIKKLRLNDSQKLKYRIFAVIFPILIFVLGRLVVSAGWAGENISNQNLAEKIILWSVVILFVFGSWIVLLYAASKQSKSSISATGVNRPYCSRHPRALN